MPPVGAAAEAPERIACVIPECFFPVKALEAPVPGAARALLGSYLRREDVILRITEVEAYAGPEDSASHARHGRTARNAAMWGPPGRAYVYFCYGVHWMLNVVAGSEGEASAVLIRAAEVVEGWETVLARRNARTGPALCAGPGKVAQALGLDRSLDAHDLLSPGGLELHSGERRGRILAGPRVGIGFAAAHDQRQAWRFADGGSAALTRSAGLRPLA